MAVEYCPAAPRHLPLSSEHHSMVPGQVFMVMKSQDRSISHTWVVWVMPEWISQLVFLLNVEISAWVTDWKVHCVSWYVALCLLELWLCACSYGVEVKVREGELLPCSVRQHMAHQQCQYCWCLLPWVFVPGVSSWRFCAPRGWAAQWQWCMVLLAAQQSLLLDIFLRIFSATWPVEHFVCQPFRLMQVPTCSQRSFGYY